tara:strand:+ start:1080 stop:2201 length:1122 start_codon:yes stop_codon:yes gene_type:complete
MANHYEDSLKENILGYLGKLNTDKNTYQYSPVLNSLTAQGKELKLGFSCLALKCYFMLGAWKTLDIKKQKEWIHYINTFQGSVTNLPANSYVDKAFVNHYNLYKSRFGIKNVAKYSMNIIYPGKYSTNNQKYEETIRAETKQAIATVFEVGYRNKFEYIEFPKEGSDINQYLDSLNWNNPWTSGAQFSSLCVFSRTQLSDSESKKTALYLYDYLEKVLNSENGLYYIGNQDNKNELINGAMKVITGLDWLDLPIHYPEKIIDFCLSSKPNQEGCDIVDIIYVLYKCVNHTNYKRKIIQQYLEDLKPLIKQHFKEAEGGFSYFTENCQQYYYGIQFSNKNNQADIHGTTLLLWALSMIEEISDLNKRKFKVIKP